MTDDEINVAIAEACGWSKEDGVYFWTANGIDCTCPELWDWCNDLNAMHEAEKVLTEMGVNKWWAYANYILRNKPTPFGAETAIHATARQRAEAFLRTLGRWRND